MRGLLALEWRPVPALPAPAPASRSVPGRIGDWKYSGVSRPRAILWLAMAFSAAFHAVLICGFTRRPAPPRVVVAEETVIRLELPPIPVDEEKPPVELSDEAEEMPAMAVPTLVDIPSHVPVATDFVQQMQVSVPIDSTEMAANLSRIPVNVSHGGGRPAGLKDLFDFNQLDRVPEPLAQPPPLFPYQLRSQVSHAEVLVEFIVDKEGRVLYATVLSTTHPGFERSAVEGVEKWRFRPGMKGGRRVNTRMRVPLRFTVTNLD